MEADEIERDRENVEKSDSSKEEEAKRQELSPKIKGGSTRFENQKSGNAEKSSPENHSISINPLTTLQVLIRHIIIYRKEDARNTPLQMRIEEVKSTGNTIEEYRRTDYVEHMQSRREQDHVVEHISKYDERRPAHGSYEQKSERGRMYKNPRSQHEEERLAEMRRYQEDL